MVLELDVEEKVPNDNPIVVCKMTEEEWERTTYQIIYRSEIAV